MWCNDSDPDYPISRKGKICGNFVYFTENMLFFKYHYTNIIVHFDLKGAPPKVGYFLSLLQLVADAGATGILIEWEDMFPWSGELEMVKSTNAYTVKEVHHILKRAQYVLRNNIRVY
ncbi:unnamed protein product [Haemonchus placei]|uniref:Glyco_hydro_18 domain-containing protein n=1 Tax=Haemonchus placei TaxID=6290 RepID=A0A0N4X4E7_HAEPC|nr:unnamed protein product [Haemonchus placei]